MSKKPEAFASIAIDTLRGEAAPLLQAGDCGELFLESLFSESMTLDDGALKNVASSSASGYGLRLARGERYAFAHDDAITPESVRASAEFVGDALRFAEGGGELSAPAPRRASSETAPAPLYGADYPLHATAFSDRIALMQEIEAYIRSLDKSIVQATVMLAANIQQVAIITAEGIVYDVRPLLRLNVSAIAERDGRRESGSFGFGGRVNFADLCGEGQWREAAQEAVRKATLNLEAKPAPCGTMPVVLGAGWPGVLLHEAVGHGLEGDFNRKKSSAFSGRIGEQVAAEGVTVIDDGTIASRRGSLTVDDEGTPTKRNVLIENGVLKAYMFDKMNALLTGSPFTGNGRRESYAHPVLPRMTNTFMSGGNDKLEDMIASVEDGLYAPDFGGGQVDITSGKFVFSASEAYRIEKGKVTHPVKGATLIGSGPDILKEVSMVGDDCKLDRGIGTCGKAGQGVPVGVGQPSMRIDAMTVGGAGA